MSCSSRLARSGLRSRLVHERGDGPRRWAAVVLIVAAVFVAPLAMPVLPINTLARYARFWDVQAVQVENVPQDDLPQLFGDMFGWEEQVATVSQSV